MTTIASPEPRPLRRGLAALMLALLATVSVSAYAAEVQAPGGADAGKPAYQLHSSHVTWADQQVPGCTPEYRLYSSKVQWLNDCSADAARAQHYRVYDSHIDWTNQ